MGKVRWGILSTAKIGVEKVIPAMQRGAHCEIASIASRDEGKAQEVATRIGIAKSFGSYEALLADPDIDAVYNPLPNDMHVSWTEKALAAGKHVLCEKPIGLSSDEARQLVATAARYPRLKVMEAFMYRHHPQWQHSKRLVGDGGVGELRTIQSFFSYFNDDPDNIRNQPAAGGGGVMDIGCYPISLSRFIFDDEPERVFGIAENDPSFGTDRLASAILDFGRGTSTFTCSTQSSPYQRVNIVGTEGRIELEIPFNAPPDKSTRLWHQRGTEIEEVVFDVCDQYTIQGDEFSRAILDDAPVPTPLADAVANMEVIEKVFASARSGSWA